MDRAPLNLLKPSASAPAMPQKESSCVPKGVQLRPKRSLALSKKSPAVLQKEFSNVRKGFQLCPKRKTANIQSCRRAQSKKVTAYFLQIIWECSTSITYSNISAPLHSRIRPCWHRTRDLSIRIVPKFVPLWLSQSIPTFYCTLVLRLGLPSGP